MCLSVTSRRPGGMGQPPRQAAGHYGECLNWANALEQPPARLRGGLRECPQISVRNLASRKSALCSRRNGNSVHKCPETVPGGRFRRSVYTLCPHGRSCDWIGPRVPRHRRSHGPRDAKALGPEAHAAGAAAHLRCQALLSPLVALECHRHGMRRMPEQGQFGWSSRLARFNAWGL